MKKIKESFVEKSRKYWRSSILTSFLTFLSSKLAGMTTSHDVHIGQEEDERFIRSFLVINGKYYNPCSNTYPDNQSEWFRTISQYRYKPEKPYSVAFRSSLSGMYTFSDAYVNFTKKHALRNQKVSLANVVLWLYRNIPFSDSENLIDAKGKFISEFHITNEELELFHDDIADIHSPFDFEPEHNVDFTVTSLGTTDRFEPSASNEPLTNMSDIKNASVDHVVEEDDSLTFPEGKEVYRLHRARERNSKIADFVKRKRLKSDSMLRCDVCTFSFVDHFGEIGKGFIEAHHTIPVSELTEASVTNENDIALVCSNCHRMLHRYRPWLKIKDLKNIRKNNAK